MLKYADFDIVFQEVPGEVTLAISISGCPNRCAGCHSEWLWEDVGESLNEQSISKLLDRYGSAVTCVCFMGGDAAPDEILHLARCVKQKNRTFKLAWYSGREALPADFEIDSFDFIKLGPYLEQRGALNCAQTNQRFYIIDGGKMIDRTNLFFKNVI